LIVRVHTCPIAESLDLGKARIKAKAFGYSNIAPASFLKKLEVGLESHKDRDLVIEGWHR